MTELISLSSCGSVRQAVTPVYVGQPPGGRASVTVVEPAKAAVVAAGPEPSVYWASTA